MICAACGTANEPGRRFCGECGAALAVACPVCGASNTPGVKFCGDCGTPLTAAAPRVAPAERPSPVAERRLVSVLFADLVGFTTLSESRDPETVRELLSRYFEVATEIIGAYGGTVEKFIGDAVMAVWGAPVAHEDDAERAVRTALDLVQAVTAIGQEIGAELTVRAGVLTGEAAVTLGATNQGLVAGDLVNTASRLQSVAPPGTVLVGESTFRAASGGIAFEPAGEQLLKGKAAPVAAYRAIRVVGRRGGAGRSEQLEAPFVGRAPELRMLKDFHMATAAERRPRLVSIIGQGGIGKSRLVWEFQKYIDGVTEVVYWHQGRSPAYGEGISFWALAEMVRGRAGITEADEPAAARDKVTALLTQWVPDDGDRRWIEPRLLQLLGIESADGERPERESLFAAWRMLFERIAEHGVVVLVFEDLQWADDGLLDFIDHVLEWSRDRPIYLITLARPELLDRRSDWGAGRRNFTSLILEPLDAGAMRELLAGLVPGLPESVVERVLDRAEGIPLYAVETVRMLLSEGLVAMEDGVYRPVGDLSELSVPASLHALIASRLDALDPLDRSLLQAASVIGKTFSVEALAAVSGETVEEVRTRVRALVRREMLALDVDTRSAEQGQYGFVQGLIREVAYGTLARADRRRLHISAARYFETLDDEGIAGALAEHYVAAYKAQPEGPEGEAIAAQARVALRAAADRARSLGSYVQTMRFLEQALEVTTDADEQRQLHMAAGEAAMVGGLRDEPVAHTQRALELARESGDRAAIVSALGEHASARGYARGDVEGALALLEPARAEYADLAESREYVHLVAELARAYLLLGRYEESLSAVDEMLPIAERLELNREAIGLVCTRGPALANLGRLREAIMVLVGAVSSASAYGFVGVELRARVNLSYAASAEDPQVAYRVAREGVEQARHLGARGPGYYLLGNAADSATRSGDWEWALPLLVEAVATNENDTFARTRLALLRGLQGDDVEAEIQAVADRLAGSTEIQQLSTLDEVRALMALARGDFREALAAARRAYTRSLAPDAMGLETAARAAALIGDRAGITDALEILATQPGRVPAAIRREAESAIAAIDGRRSEALSGYLEALHRWHELELEFEAAMCTVVMVTLLGVGAPEARRAADDARSLLERLEAKPLLALLASAVASTSAPGSVRTARPADGLPTGAASER